LMDHLNQALPWKLAWFGGWDQWPATTVESIQMQLYLLRRDKYYRTLVVPITSHIPSFETESILPMILQNTGVDLLSPPDYSRILAHGFAELIKNHLMGRRASARLSCRCRFCFSSRCSLRKAMLLPEKIHSNDRSFEGKKLTEKMMKQQQITA
uniref:Radical SAM protein n=1 Tax=Gongylonema pulchrum TaxID=637853 RepID=A0A183DFS6_9BILA